MRYCGTPNCTFKDKHKGAHSFELVLQKRRTSCLPCVPSKCQVTKDSNKFQHGIHFAQLCMQDQIGLTITLPQDVSTHSLSTHSFPSSFPSSFQATIENPVYCSDRYVFDAKVGDAHIQITPLDLVRDDTIVSWNPLSTKVFEMHKNTLSGKEHDAVSRRMNCFVQTLYENYKTDKNHIVMSLDGKGANRSAYKEAFSKYSDEKIPTFMTYEIDPAVALSQQLLFGKKTVKFTGALLKDRFGYECDSSKYPGIEYLISNRKNTCNILNTIVTREECDLTIGLNLDYCGGIIGGLDFENGQRLFHKLLSRLPSLVVLCVTFGKRKRPGLATNFEMYASTPYGFRVVHTFKDETDNKRVVSRVYVRTFSIPRTLLVPGNWWHYNSYKIHSAVVRSKHYKCVIKSVDHCEDKIILYSVEDDMDDQQFSHVAYSNIREIMLSDVNVKTDAYAEMVKILCDMKKELQKEHMSKITMIDQELQELQLQELQHKRRIDDNVETTSKTLKKRKNYSMSIA